jgi:hypothetical protein
MTMNILASAIALSNRDLLARLPQLAANERNASAELVAHLAALDMRPDVYAAEGYRSLFAYCTRVLRLSEDATCTRLAAVSACRRFPAILGLLASGALNLTAVRRLGPHLTGENWEAVLARAVNQPRSVIEGLVAELAPQPDVAPSVRKLPTRSATVAPPPAAPAPALATVPAAVTGEPMHVSTASTSTGASGAVPDRPAVGSGALPRTVHDRR